MEHKNIIVLGVFLISATILFAYYIMFYSAWTVSGYVTDYSGKPVSGVYVNFQHHEETFKAITDVNGHYEIKNNALTCMEEGDYYVSVERKNPFTTDSYFGYIENDFKIEEKKDVVKNLKWVNENLNKVMADITDAFRITFDNLRPVEHPTDADPRIRGYTEKPSTVVDEIDLSSLEDYYIMIKDFEEGGLKSISIDLMHGSEVVKQGIVITNCSTFSGFKRPSGYNTELENNIGLDIVTNKLTAEDGIVKLWTKRTWDENGQAFSDVVISPLGIYPERVKNKITQSLVSDLASKYTNSRKSGGAPGAVSTGPDGQAIDLSGLGDYEIVIKQNFNHIVCFYLYKGGVEVEKTICVNNTAVWMSRDRPPRPKDFYTSGDLILENTLGLCGVGKISESENTIKLTKEDGPVVTGLNIPGEWCSNGKCSDPYIISQVLVDKYYVLCSKTIQGEETSVKYEYKTVGCKI